MVRVFYTVFSIVIFCALIWAVPSRGAEVTEVAPGVYAFIGTNGATNSGFVATDDGVVVIDTQGPKELALELKDKATAAAEGKAITYAVNTHYHGDHTFGNQHFPVREIIAHEKTRDALITRDSAHRTRFKSFFGEESLLGFNFTPPTLTFTGSLTLRSVARVIELIHTGPAHTDGDAYAYLPAEKVVFTGDLLYKGRLPWLADGDIKGAIRALDELMALDAEVYVPGHGPIASKKDVAEYKGYLEALLDEAARLIKEGRTLPEVRTGLRLPKYKDYVKYDEWLPYNAEKAYRELTGAGH